MFPSLLSLRRELFAVVLCLLNLMHLSELPGLTFNSRIFEFSRLPRCQAIGLMLYDVLCTCEASLRYAIILVMDADWSSACSNVVSRNVPTPIFLLTLPTNILLLRDIFRMHVGLGLSLPMYDR